MYNNGKMRTFETVLGVRGRVIIVNDGAGKFNYDIL
jgi:hypothetical protein